MRPLRRPHLDRGTLISVEIDELGLDAPHGAGSGGVRPGAAGDPPPGAAGEASPAAPRDALAGLPLDSLGRMAAGIGHTFNNLLAIISAHASMLAEELSASAHPGMPVRTWLDDIAHIQRAVERATTQTGQLLTFSRRTESRPVPLDLRQLLAAAVPPLHAGLADSVLLDVACVPDLWPVTADPHLIEQVVRNLVTNASEAVPHGGRIHVRAVNLHRGSRRFVRLQIRDNGTGIPPEIVARVFEPYFSTKPAAEAGGMGLAIVHAVVTDAGGQVSLESVPGAGTTVTVLLPAADQPPVPGVAVPVPQIAAPHAAAPAAPPVIGPARRQDPAGTAATILVIEDENDLRGAVRRMLAGTGYQILPATDGMEAIRVAATHSGRVDLLLSDVLMPEMSGPEVAEQIGSIRPDLRVLFMSGYDRPFLASRAGLDPRTEVLQKPFSRDALLGRLRQVLAR